MNNIHQRMIEEQMEAHIHKAIKQTFVDSFRPMVKEMRGEGKEAVFVLIAMKEAMAIVCDEAISEES